MGLGKIFKKLEKNAEKLVNGGEVDDATEGTDLDVVDDENYEVRFEHSANPTRWEKAIIGLHGMVKQVSKVDPDGLDIVCFGGSTEKEAGSSKKTKANISVYNNVKNVKDIETMVTSKLPSGPCNMGQAMDYVLKKAFDRGFRKRPCGILVLTAGRPDDSKRLEKSLQDAAERIARGGYKEPPLSVTFVHVGDDETAEDYMQHLANNMTSHKKSKKTGEVVDIVDTIKDREIQAAMAEIRGTKSTGKTGAIIGAFAGAAMGVGGMYLYNKHQAKKRTEGWNGDWVATFESCEIAKIKVKDDMKGRLTIDGFPGGRTYGRYIEDKKGYSLTFRDPDEHWKITGDIEDEHTIFWADGTRWDEIPPPGVKWTHFAGAAVAGAATGGAIGYLLDKKFFKKASKEDQADYIIVVDRSAMMAVRDKSRGIGGGGGDDEFGGIEEYRPDENNSSSNNNGNLVTGATEKFNNLSTGEKIAVGVAGATAVAGVAAAGVGVAHAVQNHNQKKDASPVVHARSLGDDDDEPRGGLSGVWRSTFDGDELAVLTVRDNLSGLLTIDGFFGGQTVGKYRRNSAGKINKIHFIDADENWAVEGQMKGSKEQVIVWSDDTRWDKIR